MEEYVVIGKITDTFGLEGELKVIPYMPEEFFEDLQRVYLKRRGGDWVPFQVEWVDFVGDKVILKFKGVDSIEEAEQFRGAKLFLRREELPQLGKDEFYAYELVGMKVITDRGKELGKVARIRDMGPYDLLVLEGERVMFPFVSDIVLEVDREKGIIKVKEDLIPL
ncbi:MAG: 16S rRNA processing protein RimM [Aquificae bacterium]|nr:16S rRNA processing protein RimM [Aquificota bacterium]